MGASGETGNKKYSVPVFGESGSWNHGKKRLRRQSDCTANKDLVRIVSLKGIRSLYEKCDFLPGSIVALGS
jgi:hypothetical protein